MSTYFVLGNPNQIINGGGGFILHAVPATFCLVEETQSNEKVTKVQKWYWFYFKIMCSTY